MKLGVYTIFDKLADEGGPLFTAKNEAVAIRSFKMALEKANRLEYELRKVGEFDSEKCDLIGFEYEMVKVAEEVEKK